MSRAYIQEATIKLRQFYRLEKRLPTYAEFCELFHFSSKGSVQYLVAQLIEAGIIEKGENGKLFPKKLIHIPHLGTIKAGYPMPAFELRDDSIDVYQYIHDTTGDIYFLTVSGDSMIEALIGDGDKIIVDPKREPQNGDIVAAIVDNEWTVKYFYRRNGSVELVPANKNYPIIRPKQSLEISGVVISVIRKYH
jgi:SOS regulatory protein LexA